MFNCGSCQKTEGPRISPVVHGMGFGRSEIKLCRECAGLGPVRQDDGAFVVQMRGAIAAHEHLRRCHKGEEKCILCRQITLFLSTLPLRTLSAALAEPSPEPLSSSFGYVVLEGMLDKMHEENVKEMERRAPNLSVKRDSYAATALFSHYKLMGGRIGNH